MHMKIDILSISWEIALRWMLPDFTDDQSTLVQVIAWCRQATSHYLSQYCTRSILPYDITSPHMYRIMYGLPWILLFLSRVRGFGNDFDEWQSHEWKSLPNCFKSDKQLVFTIIHALIYFLHAILYPDRAHKPAKTIIECSFHHFHQGQSFLTWHCDHSSTCDVTRMRGTGIVDWTYMCKMAQTHSNLPSNEQLMWISICRHPAFTV